MAGKEQLQLNFRRKSGRRRPWRISETPQGCSEREDLAASPRKEGTGTESNRSHVSLAYFPKKEAEKYLTAYKKAAV